MINTVRILLALILAVFALSGCSNKQAPSQYSNGVGSLGDMGFIPDGDPFDGSLNDTGLQARDEGDDIGSDKYGDFTMVGGVLPSIYFGFDSSSVGRFRAIKASASSRVSRAELGTLSSS